MSRDTMKKVGAKTRSKVQKAVESRKKGISAKEISLKTGIKDATVRLHLLALKKGGSVTATRAGRSVIYTMAIPAAEKYGTVGAAVSP